MILPHFLSLTLFLCLSFLNPSQTTFINDTVVTDLLSSSSSQTQTDASSWALSSTACSTCNQVFTIPSNACGVSQEIILGGPNILGPSGSSQANQYFQRGYPITAFGWTNLAIEFDLWTFYNTVPSSPSGTDSYMIYVDDNPNTPVGISATLLSSCETINYSDASGVVIKAFYKYHVRVLMFHQYINILKIKFSSTLPSPSTQISFGLNNLVFYSDSSLQISSSISTANFPCYPNSYWTGASGGAGCASCHSYCSVCTGPSNNECDGCRMGFYSYHNRTCLDTCNAPFTPIINTITYNYCEKTCPTDFYWFYNKSCTSTCDSPLTPSVDANGLKICSNPCYYTDSTGAYVNTYLFPDQSCNVSCSSPAVIRTPYICETPCAISTYYAYQNGSCTGSCTGFLVGSTVKGISYCNSPCPGEYIYPDGTCNTDCASPLVQKDDSADIKFCLTPCADYVFQNGSCTASCAGFLVGSTVKGISYCNSPCPGEYIYPSGACETGCPSPLIKKDDSSDIKFCLAPCAGYVFQNGSCTVSCLSPLVGSSADGISYCNSLCPGDFIYPDGTCNTDCVSPLVQKDDSADIKFCLTPCESPDDYYFTNGTCNSTCPFPLVGKTEAGIKYCYNPCAANGTYLYDNGTCLSTCSSPNILRTKSMGELCNFPCSDTALYFYSSDGSCQATCVYPNSAVESPLPKTCTLGLSQSETEEVKKLAGVTGTAGSVSSGGILLLSLLSSSDSTSICMGPFSKMLQYVRFMNVVYPAKVILMFESQANKSKTRGFTSKMIGGILDGFPENDELPEKFVKYETKSSFFVNFWPALFNLLVILLVISVVLLAGRWSRSCLKVNKVVKSLEDMLKWNVLLVTFCGSFCDIFLFTALEFHTTKFTNVQGPISFVTCLAINLFVMFVVFKILEVNFEVRKSRKEFEKDDIESQELQLTKEWCHWSAFFVAYKGESYYQQIFLFIFLARLALFGSVIGYLYEYPLMQAIIITLTNISILLYLGINRPMKHIASFIQQAVLELVLLAFNLCVLTLAILDAKGIDAFDERNKIASIMVYINFVTPVLSVALMGIKFLFIGITVYQQWKVQKKNKKDGIKRVKREKITLAGETFPQKIQARPFYQDKKSLFRQVSSNSGSSVLDMSALSLNGSTIVNPDNSNSSFVFHQTRSPSPRRQQQKQAMSNSSLLRPPQNDSLMIQHNDSSPQRSIFSTAEKMNMSQISMTGSYGSPNSHRRIARRKNPVVVSARKASGPIIFGG